VEALPIGQVVATEDTPNTAYSFTFWAQAQARLGIGSLVKVVTDEAGTQVVVHGIVVEAHAYNDVASALVDFFGSRGEPGVDAPTRRSEIRVFEAAVLRREPEDHPATAVGIGAVYRASEEDVRVALGDVDPAKAIPVGCYRDGDNYLPVYADCDFLIGPEAGHLNITGTSGLAAKTSYVEFLLSSIFQHFKGEGVAAVLFNVKGGDLLYLDHDGKLEDEDKRLYDACKIKPQRFENVRYYAPYADASRETLRSHRDHADFADNPTSGFCYGLADVLANAHVLLNRDDLDVKADAVLQYLREEVADKHDFKAGPSSPVVQVETIDDLCKAIDEMLKVAKSGEKEDSYYNGMHVATLAKMKSRISGFSSRLPGLVTKVGQSKNPLPAVEQGFEDRSLHVIDVSDVTSDGQDLIFAATMTDLQKRMENGTLGVRHLIVVVDELNKYAPSGGHETYVLSTLRDIAARGRYLGLVLFGAQQFRSRVDAQIVGNCANSAYGHIQMEELAQPSYTVYSQAVREKLATADPGEIMFRHPRFSQPIFVRFPRPAVLKGSDGMKKWPKKKAGELDAIFRLANGTAKGDIIRALEHVEHAKRGETIAQIVEALSKDSSNPLATIRRIAGSDKRVYTGGGITNPIDEI
jgi:hypothetical protein